MSTYPFNVWKMMFKCVWWVILLLGIDRFDDRCLLVWSQNFGVRVQLPVHEHIRVCSIFGKWCLMFNEMVFDPLLQKTNLNPTNQRVLTFGYHHEIVITQLCSWNPIIFVANCTFFFFSKSLMLFHGKKAATMQASAFSVK